MPTKLMTVPEWIAVPDNPIQRDTERHAAKAKHLLTPLPTHAIVFACQLPNGDLVKLDGHTRALIWSRDKNLHPRNGHVEVNLVGVKTLEEAAALYKTFDSKEALETVPDKVSGAFHRHNFHPESGLLKGGNISVAMRMCWQVFKGFGAASSGWSATKSEFDIYTAINEFATELFALDSFELGQGGAKAGIVAAFVLTYRKHGAKAIPFWTAFFGEGGERIGGRMDGVQALREVVLQRKGNSSNSVSTQDLCARAVMAYEKWQENELFDRIPRPFDLVAYIHKTQPETKLIKKAESAVA